MKRPSKKECIEIQELKMPPPKRISHFLKVIYKRMGKGYLLSKCRHATAYSLYSVLPWKYKWMIINRIKRLPLIYDY